MLCKRGPVDKTTDCGCFIQRGRPAVDPSTAPDTSDQTKPNRYTIRREGYWEAGVERFLQNLFLFVSNTHSFNPIYTHI